MLPFPILPGLHIDCAQLKLFIKHLPGHRRAAQGAAGVWGGDRGGVRTKPSEGKTSMPPKPANVL